ncbi:MAG: DUF4384 domain-containing protein [Acidobacteriota bacterium]
MRQKVIATIVAVIYVLASTALSQQFNPFTVVLNTPLTRPPVKEGRQRIAISTTKGKTIKNTIRNKTKRTQPEEQPALNEQPQSDAERSQHKHSTAQAEKVESAITPLKLTPAELDLRRNIGIKYQILSEDSSGQLRIDDPQRVYRSGEAFRIKLQSNINSYLYLLTVDPHTGARSLLFPNFKYQRGNARVKPYTPIVVPPLGQPAFEFDNVAGEEQIIVICSRDEIPALQLNPIEKASAAAQFITPGVIPRDIESTLTHQDEPGARDFIWVAEQPPGQTSAANAGTYIVNTSRKDNEEIVYLIRLKHKD